MDWLQHPAAQSLLLPALLSLLCLGLSAVLSRALPAHPAAWMLGAALAQLLSLAVWPGLHWPVGSAPGKLPWIALIGLLAMLPTLASRRDAPARPWGLAAIAWLGVAVWLLGPSPTPGRLLAEAGGVLLLAVLAWSPRAPQAAPTAAAASAAALTVALLGLVALALRGGSLLLAQLGLVLAVCAALPGLWLWARPRAGLRLGAAALMPSALAGLALACLLHLGGQAPPAALALLGLCLSTPWWFARRAWSARHWRWRPLVVALLAGLPLLLALAWQALDRAPRAAGGDAESPYYQPNW